MHAIWCAPFIFIREINIYFTFEFVGFHYLVFNSSTTSWQTRKIQKGIRSFLMTSLVRAGDSQNETYVSGVERKRSCWPVFALCPPCSTFIACFQKKKLAHTHTNTFSVIQCVWGHRLSDTPAPDSAVFLWFMPCDGGSVDSGRAFICNTITPPWLDFAKGIRRTDSTSNLKWEHSYIPLLTFHKLHPGSCPPIAYPPVLVFSISLLL